jgi:hypothetical protein
MNELMDFAISINARRSDALNTVKGSKNKDSMQGNAVVSRSGKIDEQVGAYLKSSFTRKKRK